jgi:hypothetical protein
MAYYPQLLPGSLRRVADLIDCTGSVAIGDREYLLEVADKIDRGTATEWDVQDAIWIAIGYDK